MGYIIRTRDDFLINGVSALTVGLVTEMPQPMPMAARRYADYSAGSDFDIAVDDNSFDSIQYTITARVIKKPNNFNNAEIYAFLQGAKTLQLTRMPGYYFRIQKVLGIEPVANRKYNGNEQTYTIGFQLEPFKYHLSDEPITHEGAGSTFYFQNAGTRFSKPVYTFTLSALSGLGGFIVNNAGVVISIPENALTSTQFTVDTERMIAYSGSGNTQTNAMMYTTGTFPFSASGTNAMILNGILGAVSIKLNQRSY